MWLPDGEAARAVWGLVAAVRADVCSRGGANGSYQLCWNSNGSGLARAERDNAPDRIVRRDADGHAIPRNYLDAEAAHTAAQLGEHLMAGVTLHAVQPAAVNRNHRALHIDQIVLAQLLAVLSNKHYAIATAF